MPMASHCFTSHSFNPKSFKDFTCESPIFTELGYPLQGENDYIAFDEYYNEPIGRSFGNSEIPFVTS